MIAQQSPRRRGSRSGRAPSGKGREGGECASTFASRSVAGPRGGDAHRALTVVLDGEEGGEGARLASGATSAGATAPEARCPVSHWPAETWSQVSWPGADRAQPAGARQGRPPGRYRLTPRDRHAGFAEAHSAAFDMGGNLVAEVAVQGRAEPGGLSAATCRPDG